MSRPNGLPSRRWLRFAVVWAFAILAFGVLPTQAIVDAATPGRETESTLAGHFLEYAVLGALLGLALGATTTGPAGAKRALTTMLLCASLGFVVELAQGPLPYRDFQATDILVNVLGAAVGLAVARTIAPAWAR